MMFYEILFGFMPFYGSSPDDLHYQINKNALKFPKNHQISSNTKDFIQRALKIEESERLSWESILSHPVFDAFHQKTMRMGLSLSTYQKTSQNNQELLSQSFSNRPDTSQRKKRGKNHHSKSIEIINNSQHLILKCKKRLEIMFQQI